MKRRYRNTAFLLELAVNILVFSISCAVLVGLFGKAWQLSRDTQSETAAANEVLAVTETVKARGTADMLGGGGGQPGQALLFYNEDWQPVDGPAGCTYAITVTETRQPTETGTLVHIEVAAIIYDSPDVVGTDPIYAVSTSVYHPAEGGDGP